MPPRKPLDPDEAALFEQSLADARKLKDTRQGGRLKPAKLAPPAPPPPAIKPAAKPAPVPPEPAKLEPGSSRPQPLEPGAAIGLDRRLAERLKRGQLPIEARLDLHGHTLNNAVIELEDFLLRAAKAGRRCVLIVTGKGLAGGGALKREVPRWLNLPGLRAQILAFTPAQPKHGGDGALYVLLKRRRE